MKWQIRAVLRDNTNVTRFKAWTVEAPSAARARSIAEGILRRDPKILSYDMEAPATSSKNPPVSKMRYAFHWTKAKYMPEISRHGLQPSTAERCNYEVQTTRAHCAGRVFFSLQPDRWYQGKRGGGDMVLLRVDRRYLRDAKRDDGVEFIVERDEDPRAGKPSDLYVERVVPPLDIEAQIAGRWRSVRSWGAYPIAKDNSMKLARYPLPMELRYRALGLRERGKLAQAMALEKQAQIAEANPRQRYYFHAAPVSVRESIAKHGLRPGKVASYGPPAIYVFKNQMYAENYREGSWDIWRVDLAATHRIHPDPEDPQAASFVLEPVPPQQLKFLGTSIIQAPGIPLSRFFAALNKYARDMYKRGGGATRNPGSVPLSRLFAALKKKAAEKLPWIAKVRLSRCAMAEKENKESARQVMHTGHKPLCVCYAKISETFATPIKVGLLVHELGHFAAGGGDVGRPHTEPAANKYGRALTGIGVSYAGPLRLQRSKVPAWLADAVGGRVARNTEKKYPYGGHPCPLCKKVLVFERGIICDRCLRRLEEKEKKGWG